MAETIIPNSFDDLSQEFTSLEGNIDPDSTNHEKIFAGVFGIDIMSEVTLPESPQNLATYTSGGWTTVPGTETMPLDNPNDPAE